MKGSRDGDGDGGREERVKGYSVAYYTPLERQETKRRNREGIGKKWGGGGDQMLHEPLDAYYPIYPPIFKRLSFEEVNE